jgi:hypothetical protein
MAMASVARCPFVDVRWDNVCTIQSWACANAVVQHSHPARKSPALNNMPVFLCKFIFLPRASERKSERRKAIPSEVVSWFFHRGFRASG